MTAILKRIDVDLVAYAETMDVWRDHLQRWRHAAKYGASQDLDLGRACAPSRFTLVCQWLPRGEDATRFLIETLALTQWPQTAAERRLGVQGKRLIPHLVFSYSINPAGRPPEFPRHAVLRSRIATLRPAILRHVQTHFRDTRDAEERTDRQAWLRTFIKRRLRQLPAADLDRYSRFLSTQKPAYVANWLVGRRLRIRPATVQRLAAVARR